MFDSLETRVYLEFEWSSQPELLKNLNSQLKKKENWQWAESTLFWLNHSIHPPPKLLSSTTWTSEELSKNKQICVVRFTFSFGETGCTLESLHAPFYSILQNAPYFFSELNVVKGGYYEYDNVDQMPGEDFLLI